MDILGFVIAVVLGVGLGTWLNRRMKPRSAWIRQPIAWIVGIAVWLGVFGAFLPAPEDAAHTEAASGEGQHEAKSEQASAEKITQDTSAETKQHVASATQRTGADEAEDQRAKARKKVEARAELGFTTEEFAKKYNAALKSVKVDHSISPAVEHSTQAADTFKANVDRFDTVTGTVKQSNGQVVDVTLIGAGNGTQKSGAAIILAATALFSAVGDMSPHDAAQIVLGLTKNLSDGSTAQRTVGDLRYSYERSQYMGNWFIVQPAANSG